LLDDVRNEVHDIIVHFWVDLLLLFLDDASRAYHFCFREQILEAFGNQIERKVIRTLNFLDDLEIVFRRLDLLVDQLSARD
jgi:hypothetical protein